MQQGAVADTTQNDIEAVEKLLLDLPQVDIPVTHRFAPGIYWREMTAPADAFIIGHRHKHATLNVLLKGRIKVFVNGKVQILCAPFVVVSQPGERKIAYCIDEVIWANAHPTDETDLDKIEEMFIEKSPSFIDHATRAELAQLAASPNTIELEVLS